MVKNPPENIPIILFCFDFWKQMCVILLPVGCSHDLTNLQHKRACQRTSTLFCVGDQSRCNHTYGMLLFLSDWSIIIDIIVSITMISWWYLEQKIVNEYSPNYYNDELSQIFDKHAQEVEKEIVFRKPTPWTSEDIKPENRKYERMWMQTKLQLDFDAFKTQINKVNTIVNSYRVKYCS